MKKLFDSRSHESSESPLTVLQRHLENVGASITVIASYVAAKEATQAQVGRTMSQQFFNTKFTPLLANKAAAAQDAAPVIPIEKAPSFAAPKEAEEPTILSEEIELDPLQLAAMQADQQAPDAVAAQPAFEVSEQDRIEADRQSRIIEASELARSLAQSAEETNGTIQAA